MKTPWTLALVLCIMAAAPAVVGSARVTQVLEAEGLAAVRIQVPSPPIDRNATFATRVVITLEVGDAFGSDFAYTVFRNERASSWSHGTFRGAPIVAVTAEGVNIRTDRLEGGLLLAQITFDPLLLAPDTIILFATAASTVWTHAEVTYSTVGPIDVSLLPAGSLSTADVQENGASVGTQVGRVAVGAGNMTIVPDGRLLGLAYMTPPNVGDLTFVVDGPSLHAVNPDILFFQGTPQGTYSFAVSGAGETALGPFAAWAEMPN